MSFVNLFLAQSVFSLFVMFIVKKVQENFLFYFLAAIFGLRLWTLYRRIKFHL
jgi:hypothetical protein